jgi:hypothetical protein
MRKAITLLLGSSILFTSGAALAQYQQGGQAGGQYGGTYQPQYSRPSNTDNIGGSDGQFVFGVDRVMGVFANRLKLENEDTSATASWTTIALFGNGAISNVHSMPRLALDYFVVEGFSLGGSFVYWRMSGELEPEEGDATDLPTLSSVLFNPRLGYSFVIDETLAIWPRAGITYGNSKSEQTTPSATGDVDTSLSLSTWAITAEVPFVISPIENFAITAAPFIDFGVGGTLTTESDPGESVEVDAKMTTFGAWIGIAGYY